MTGVQTCALPISEIKEIINLDSGEEETLDWEWESENPSEVTFIVETLLENDESHRNNLMKEDIDITMICIPEITTFNDHKEGTEISFDIDFEIENKVLNVLMSKSFEFGLNKIADAFQKRAEDLYRPIDN